MHAKIIRMIIISYLILLNSYHQSLIIRLLLQDVYYAINYDADSILKINNAD